MQYNVASLLKEPNGSTREYQIDDDVVIDRVKRHVTGHVRFDRTPRGMLVRALLHGTMDDVCARCVRPVSYPIDLEVAEEYLPTVDLASGGPLAVEEGDEDAYRIDAHHVIDLTEATVQYWAFALLMAPLCDENCAGLCPVCGEELVSAGHTCSADQVDSRWSALGTLQLG